MNTPMPHSIDFVNSINLGRNKEDLKQCKAALVQFWVDENDYVSFHKKNYRFKESKVSNLKKRIINILRNCKEKRGVDIVVFPEISVPIAALQDIRRYCDKKHLYFIGGLEYDEFFRNCSCVIIPKSADRDSIVYRCAKMNPAPGDHKRMKSGNHINCYLNTGFGDFTVLVCYDFTDIRIMQRIRGYVDIVFVISYNQSVSTFSDRARDSCVNNYCYVLIANTAFYGGTCAYFPQVERKIGNDLPKEKEDTKYVHIDVAKLRTRPRSESFRNIHAGYKRIFLNIPENQPLYSLLDWPRPFSDDCIVVLGDTRNRVISDLSIGDEDRESVKEKYPKFYRKLEKYLWDKDKYFQAKTVDALLLPRLIREFAVDGQLNIPDLFLDTILITENKKNSQILKEHNIISIGGPTVNKVSDSINEELKKDKKIYCERGQQDEMWTENIYDYIDSSGQIVTQKEHKGFMAITRNPWNKQKKVALLVAGYRSAGTLASLKRLKNASSDPFSIKYRYGQVIDSDSIDVDKEIKSFYGQFYGRRFQ
jgi:predicted amidohydrolase